MSSTRSKLIELLSKNQHQYISGQHLSNSLKISRSAIWKHMNELKKDGYDIEGVTRKGYRIVSFPEKVSENTIQWGLNTFWAGKKVYYKETIDSTQRLAHQLALDGAEHGTIVIADEQVKGKGRTGRHWQSHKSLGVWMSIILRPNILPYAAPQLTLVTATVIANLIEELTGIRPHIKWPNDILVNDKKIAGILTEMQAEQDKVNYVIIGIGLNVNQLSTDFDHASSYPITSLRMETNETWSLIKIIQQMLQIFESKFDHFMTNGFQEVKKEWEHYGFKMNEQIQIKSGQNNRYGTFLGIAEDGALLIKNEEETIEKIYSAEIMWF